MQSTASSLIYYFICIYPEKKALPAVGPRIPKTEPASSPPGGEQNLPVCNVGKFYYFSINYYLGLN